MGLLVLLLWGIPSFPCFLSPLDSLPLWCYLPVCVYWSLPCWSSLFSCCCLLTHVMDFELYHSLFTLIKGALCFHNQSLHWFQVLNRLTSPKRLSLWLQLFLLQSVCCHNGISLSRLPSSPCLSPSQCTYSSKTWKRWLSCKCRGSELLCNCPSPTGSLVSSFVYLGFWIPLGLPHIAWTSWMLCICFLSFNAHWSWTTHFLQLCFDLRISTSNNLIALSSCVKSGHSYSWCKSTLRSLL